MAALFLADGGLAFIWGRTPPLGLSWIYLWWILKLPTLVANEKAHGSYRKESRGATPAHGCLVVTSTGDKPALPEPPENQQPPTPPPKPPPRLGEEFAHDSLGKSNTCCLPGAAVTVPQAGRPKQHTLTSPRFWRPDVQG